MKKKLREILPIIEAHGAIFVPPGHDVSFNRFRSLSPNQIIGAGNRSLTAIKKSIRAYRPGGTVSINDIARWKPNRIMQRVKGQLGLYNNETMTKAREFLHRGNIMRGPLGIGTGAGGGSNSIKPNTTSVPKLRKRPGIGAINHQQNLIKRGGGHSFKAHRGGAKIQTGSWNKKPSSNL